MFAGIGAPLPPLEELPTYGDLANEALREPVHTFDHYVRASEPKVLASSVPSHRPETGSYPRHLFSMTATETSPPVARLTFLEGRKRVLQHDLDSALRAQTTQPPRSPMVEETEARFEAWLRSRLPDLERLGEALFSHAHEGFLRFGLFSDPRGGYLSDAWPFNGRDFYTLSDGHISSVIGRVLGAGACFVERRGAPRSGHPLSHSRGASDVYQAWIDWSAALGATCPPCDPALERRIIENELGRAGSYVHIPVRPVESFGFYGNTFNIEMIDGGFID